MQIESNCKKRYQTCERNLPEEFEIQENKKENNPFHFLILTEMCEAYIEEKKGEISPRLLKILTEIQGLLVC